MTTKLTKASRLRFAPSPTGTLHVGGARTALFNWLLARGCGGKFILRIEDTDRERSTEESVQVILDAMAWLGLDYDEGPFYQSRRREHYDSALARLSEDGRAYPCFCTTERLDALRKQARADGTAFVYDGLCRELGEDERARRIEKGEPHVVRFAVEPGSITSFEDLIGGPRQFENDRLGDFVIRRSDGSPIYHLTVVVDDHEMGITHVVRGDDHLSNTPRQLLLFDALGWDRPHFAHLPLIQGPDKARLSKRHGATSVLEFRDEGFLPDAMINFFALLGWSLDAETERLTRAELIENFSLDRVNRSAAVFDKTKLEWMNGIYMRAKPLTEVTQLARDFFRNDPADGLDLINDKRLDEPWFESIVTLEVERSRTLGEMRRNLDCFLVDSIESYEEKGARKHLLKPGVCEQLARTAEALGAVESFEAEGLEAALRGLAESEGLSFGKVVHPLRMSLTGRSASPGIFDVLIAFGRERSLERIEQARKWIEAQPPASASPASASPASASPAPATQGGKQAK